jgi:hypothetical protein
MKRPLRPQMTQRKNESASFSGRRWLPVEDEATIRADAAIPHRNGAGKRIEAEP